MAALFFNPAFGLILVTLRTGTISAGVVRVDFLLAVIALMDMASEERRAAGGNIPQSPLLHRAQADTGLLAIRRAVEADDIGHLRHEDPALEVFHEFIERIGLSISDLPGSDVYRPR